MNRTASFILVLLCLSSAAKAQGLQVFTKTSSKPPVLIVWEADSTKGMATQYFLYRKLAADASYPALPLSSHPIEPATSCSAFQAVIPPGSDEWKLLIRAFSGVKKQTQIMFKSACAITSFPVGSPEWQRVQLFARARYRIALVMGQAYIDSTAVNGQQYSYQLRMVQSSDAAKLATLQHKVVGNVAITAGSPAAVPAPDNVRCVSGDSRVQVLWNTPAPEHALFSVHRALSPGGPFMRVSATDISTVVTLDIDSNAVSPHASGFTDYEHWDSTGAPAPRTVPGNPTAFTGPTNGTSYYYTVRLRDLFGNEGPPSAPPAVGKPRDRTPPSTPGDVLVSADESKSTFEIRWRAVRRDADGHPEAMGQYRVFRYDTPDDPASGATLVSGLVPQPSDSTLLVTKVDKTAGLRSACGDRIYYFRVQAIDAAGNASRHSIAVSAVLKDTTGPASPAGVQADAHGDRIRVSWKLGKDCDIERYNVYRALCDYGAWLPCPDTTQKEKPKPSPAKGDCGGPFEFRGSVSYADAVTMAKTGLPYFDDAPPAGSPVCYAYLVKAQDSSQNLSGAWPVTDPASEEIVCQRLRDTAPPEAAVVSGLFALDSAIRVEYIGPPIQDIAAYHVYRSDVGEAGPFDWIGGMTVEQPPAAGKSLTKPFTGVKYVGCDSIPLASNPAMSAGAFLDRKVKPKTIYWYKVLGVDFNGNQTSPDSAVAVSTFTFMSGREAGPSIASVAPADNPCALRVEWTPAYDAATMRGFAVFRSAAPAGPFFQLGALVAGNTLADRSVARGVTYWYRVALVKRDGSLTSLSAPAAGVHPSEEP